MRLTGSWLGGLNNNLWQQLLRKPDATTLLSGGLKASQGEASQQFASLYSQRNQQQSQLVTYSNKGALPKDAALALVKSLSSVPELQRAIGGVADPDLRALVKTGQLPGLPKLSDAQVAKLTPAQKNIYDVITRLQAAQTNDPRTAQDALRARVATVLATYPDQIAKLKADLTKATGVAQKADITTAIKPLEGELEAAKQGKLQIRDIDDVKLIRDTGKIAGRFTAADRLVVDTPALQRRLGTTNVLAGLSANFGTYAISW